MPNIENAAKKFNNSKYASTVYRDLAATMDNAELTIGEDALPFFREQAAEYLVRIDVTLEILLRSTSQECASRIASAARKRLDRFLTVAKGIQPPKSAKPTRGEFGSVLPFIPPAKRDETWKAKRAEAIQTERANIIAANPDLANKPFRLPIGFVLTGEHCDIVDQVKYSKALSRANKVWKPVWAAATEAAMLKAYEAKLQAEAEAAKATERKAPVHGVDYDFFPPDAAAPPDPDKARTLKKTKTGKNFESEPYDFWSPKATEKLREGMIPELIENIAFEYAQRTGLDRDALAMTMLTVASGVVSAKINVANSHAEDETFIEALNIWTLNHGPAGCGKTPIMKMCMRAVDEIEAKFAKEYSADKKAYDDLDKDEKRETDRPVRRRVKLATDSTAEAAAVQFSENSPHGLLGVYDELVSFLGSRSRYSQGAEQAARGFWLPVYDGADISEARVGRETPDGIKSASIVAGVQPAVMGQLAEATQNNDGLIARFNFNIMPDMPGEPDEDVEVKFPTTRYDELIRNLYFNCPLRATGATLHFHNDALPVKAEFFKWVTRQVTAYREISPALSSHVSKFKGMFLRFCGVFHMIEHWGDRQPRVISVKTARMVYKYLSGPRFSNARAFFDALRQNDEHDDLLNIAEFILANGLQVVSAREMQRGSARLKKISTKDIAHTAGTLVSYGWLYHIVGKRIDSFNWDVNPQVHELFADRVPALQQKLEERQNVFLGIDWHTKDGNDGQK